MEIERAVRDRRVRETVVWSAALALFALPVLAQAIESAMHFAGSSIDGPFQLYNGLRRIAAGFTPGVDFQYFHGLGVPYVHYWLFRALGGQFHDSELARQLVSAIVFPVSAVLLYRALAGSWRRALCLTTATLALVLLFRMPALPFAVNSMIGLRSALPTLLPIALYLGTRRVRVIGGGIVMGLALFVSSEQGLAVMAAFIIVSAVTTIRSAARRVELLDAATTLAVGIASLIAALVVVGGFAGAAGALRYNFQTVPMDQYWFFGAPPNPFISSWRALPAMLIHVPQAGAAVLVGVVVAILYLVRLWRAAPFAATPRQRAFALLALYGIISCASLLGVFVPVYALPCWRVLFAIGLLELLAWTERRGDATAGLSTVPRPFALGVAGLVLITFFAGGVHRAWTRVLPHTVLSHIVLRDRFTISGIWPQTLAVDTTIVNHIADSTHRAPVVWSTYAGWLEGRAGVFHPSFDYVIHALGPRNRQRYIDEFKQRRPDLVQTILPGYTIYEPWIENANWDLYHELLAAYAVRARTPWSVLWRPRAASDTGFSARPLGDIAVADGADAVQMPTVPNVDGSAVALVEVEITYSTHNPFRRLPVVGAMPRYLVGIEGAITRMPVSLDPFVATMRFPVVAVPGQRPILRFGTFSLLPGASLHVSHVRLTALSVAPANRSWIRALAAAEAP